MCSNNVDIACITETWLKPETCSVSAYGGVGIAKRQVRPAAVQKAGMLRVLSHIVVGIIYHPPSADDQPRDDISHIRLSG